MHVCICGWDVIRMRDEEEEWPRRECWRRRLEPRERYLERRPVRHGEASGWRLKGCGELKRGLKNYRQGRVGIRVALLPRRLGLARKQDGEESPEKEKERSEARIRREAV